MQPTVPPWAWVTWERRGRARASPPDYRSHVRLLPRNHDDKYSFYGLRKDSRHFIRLDSLGKSFLLNRPWAASSAPVTWRVDHFHDADAWRGHDIKSYRPYEPVSIVLPASGVSGASGGAGAGAAGHAGAVGAGAGAGGAGGGAGGAGWGQAARGWAGGALLLALLVLLVRAAENCLHKRLFKAIYMHTNVGAGVHQQETMQGQYIYTANGVRRQESDEWSTPNVTATSLQHQTVSLGSLPRLVPPSAFPEASADLPPPYSECAGAGGGPGKLGEEPPPPYSDCCVAYTNPKDGVPTVQILTRYNSDQPHTSIDIDNVQNDLIESGHRSIPVTSNSVDLEVDSTMRTELVFDNGRIIERASLDVNSTDDENTNDVGGIDQVSGDARKDYVVCIDETVTTDATARALLV